MPWNSVFDNQDMAMTLNAWPEEGLGTISFTFDVSLGE